MKKEDDIGLPLTSFEFISRHPWLFLCPFVIIASIACGIVANGSAFYKCSAVLSLENPKGNPAEAKAYTQTTLDLLSRVLLGDNIRSIAEQVWPQLKEKNNPYAYSAMMENLRNSKNGILLEYDKKDPRTLTISYKYQDPAICYKVVKATIDMIQKENSSSRKEALEKSLALLKKQVDFYKVKLRSLDNEINDVKSEIMSKLPELSDVERSQVQDMIKESNIQIMPAPEQSPRYGEMIAETNLQLLDAEKKKSDLKESLERGSIGADSTSADNLKEDPYIKKYSEVLAEKQLTLAGLLSEGYMPEHPNVKKIKREIADLKKLKTARVEELIGNGPKQSESEDEKKIAVESAKIELQNIEKQIGTLHDKINMLRGYQDGGKGQANITTLHSKNVQSLIERLRELQSEKQVSLTYHTDLRKELETAEIKNREQQDRVEKSTFTVVEEPEVPVKPIPFRTSATILMGFVLGILAGTGLAYVADAVKHSINSSAELRELLGVPVLAIIDRMDTPGEMQFRKTRAKIILIGLLVFSLTSKYIVKLVMTILYLK